MMATENLPKHPTVTSKDEYAGLALSY